MKYSDLFRTAAAVALSIIVAAVPAMAKNGNPKVAKPMAGPKAKAPRVQAAKAPSTQARRATTQKPQVSSVTAPRGNTRPTTSARRSSASRFFADPASGFKNSGQYRATVNNANNLGLDFWLLKDLMVNQGYSLGQAKKLARAMDTGKPPTTSPPTTSITPIRPRTKPATTSPPTTSINPRKRPVIQSNTKPPTTSPPTTSITPRGRRGNATVVQANTEPSTTSPPTTSITPRRRPGNATVVQANTDKPPTTSPRSPSTSRKGKDKS